MVKIATDKDAGKAARYAKFVLEQIEGYELALDSAKQVRLQNEQLQKIKAGINKARATRLAGIEDLGRFAVVGKLQSSSIYGSEPGLKRYRIIGKSGKTICYALPSGQASQMDLSKLIERSECGDRRFHQVFIADGKLARSRNALERSLGTGHVVRPEIQPEGGV